MNGVAKNLSVRVLRFIEPPRCFWGKIKVAVLQSSTDRRAIHLWASKVFGNSSAEKEIREKRPSSLAIPFPSDARGSRVHLATDETWLIAVAVSGEKTCLPVPVRTWHSGFYLTVSSSASFIFIHPRLSPLHVVPRRLSPVVLLFFSFYPPLMPPAPICPLLPRPLSFAVTPAL